MSDITHSRHHRLPLLNVADTRPIFSWCAVGLALLSLALSALTVTARAKLWLGPQTLVLGAVGLLMGSTIALVAWRLTWTADTALLDRPAFSRRGVLLIFLSLIALSVAILYFAFAAFPNSADEYGYLFQALTFSHGRLWNAPPSDPVLFGQNLVVAKDGKWISQYLPAWPAIMALFDLVRLPPWLATPACGAGLLLTLWAALRLECRSHALTVALLLAYGSTGFFLLNNATYFSHCLSGFIVVGSIVCLLCAGRSSSWWWPTAAGACFGLALLCRIDSAVLVAVAAIAAWIEQGCRWRTLILGIVGAAPFVLAALGYNWLVTGYPLLPPTAWAGNVILNANGVQGVEAGPQHLRMLVQTFWRLGELADTASLLLPALYCVALGIRLRTRTVRFYDLVPIANLIVFLIYPDNGGFQMGPRYWFDGFVVMHITIGSVFSTRPIAWQRFATACCLLLAPVSLARLPAQVGFQARIMHERSSVFRLGDAIPTDRRSVVLVNDFFSTWNERADRTSPNLAKDFIRNGTQLNHRVLYAHGDLPGAVERACEQYPDAAVYEFGLDPEHPAGELTPVSCPG